MRTADQPIRISLFAPNGRMGKAIVGGSEDPGFIIDNDHGDVLVDFSAPDALQASLDRAISAGVPILVGTTGLNEAPGGASRGRRAGCGPAAANTSLGVALLSGWWSAPRGYSAPSGTSKSSRASSQEGRRTFRDGARARSAAARGRDTTLKAELGRDGTPA